MLAVLAVGVLQTVNGNCAGRRGLSGPEDDLAFLPAVLQQELNLGGILGIHVGAAEVGVVNTVDGNAFAGGNGQNLDVRRLFLPAGLHKHIPLKAAVGVEVLAPVPVVQTVRNDGSSRGLGVRIDFPGLGIAACSRNLGGSFALDGDCLCYAGHRSLDLLGSEDRCGFDCVIDGRNGQAVCRMRSDEVLESVRDDSRGTEGVLGLCCRRRI